MRKNIKGRFVKKKPMPYATVRRCKKPGEVDSLRKRKVYHHVTARRVS